MGDSSDRGGATSDMVEVVSDRVERKNNVVTTDDRVLVACCENIETIENVKLGRGRAFWA